MRGKIVKLNKATGRIFYIEGEDGNTYFGHKDELVNKKQWNHYVYKDAKCEFDVLDEGKTHLKAKNIVMDNVYDPFAEERKARAAETKARHEANVQKKLENKAKAEKKLAIKQARVEYETEHLKYVLQKYVDGEWKTIRPHVISDSVEVVRLEANRRKIKTGEKYRVKKCLVHIIGENTIIKEYSK